MIEQCTALQSAVHSIAIELFAAKLSVTPILTAHSATERLNNDKARRSAAFAPRKFCGILMGPYRSRGFARKIPCRLAAGADQHHQFCLPIETRLGGNYEYQALPNHRGDCCDPLRAGLSFDPGAGVLVVQRLCGTTRCFIFAFLRRGSVGVGPDRLVREGFSGMGRGAQRSNREHRGSGG